MASLRIKRGDTFARTGTYTVDGAPASIATKTIRGQLRFPGTIEVFDYAIAKLPDVSPTIGKFTFGLADAIAARLPVGTGRSDFEIVDADGYIESTETFQVSIIEDITR